jgi:hypothetical protein
MSGHLMRPVAQLHRLAAKRSAIFRQLSIARVGYASYSSSYTRGSHQSLPVVWTQKYCSLAVTTPPTAPGSTDFEVIQGIRDQLKQLCDKKDYTAMVQMVGDSYAPLLREMMSEDRADVETPQAANLTFNPKMTALVEAEAMALFVINQQHDAATFLYNNIREMASAFPHLVKPARDTLSFAVGMFEFRQESHEVLAAFEFATSMAVYPTDSMNASYLKHLMILKQFETAAAYWRGLVATQGPRNAYAYRAAIQIFAHLQDFVEMKSILEDIELHGTIKLREVDVEYAMKALRAGFEGANETRADGPLYAEAILDLFEHLETFEGVSVTRRSILAAAMAARNYLGEYHDAWQLYQRLPTNAVGVAVMSPPFFERLLVHTLIGLERTDEIVPRALQHIAAEQPVQASALLGELILEMAKQDQTEAFIRVLETWTVHLSKEKHPVSKDTKNHRVDVRVIWHDDNDAALVYNFIAKDDVVTNDKQWCHVLKDANALLDLHHDAKTQSNFRKRQWIAALKQHQRYIIIIIIIVSRFDIEDVCKSRDRDRESMRSIGG